MSHPKAGWLIKSHSYMLNKSIRRFNVLWNALVGFGDIIQYFGTCTILTTVKISKHCKNYTDLHDLTMTDRKPDILLQWDPTGHTKL